VGLAAIHKTQALLAFVAVILVQFQKAVHFLKIMVVFLMAEPVAMGLNQYQI
jgi:hypothetical protein